MLILTRRIGESLQIGSEVKVTVMSVAGNQVKIGIEAPHEVPVHRQEVYERIQRERGDAPQDASNPVPVSKSG
jgi:carbon storage regulator